jgi:hypothetical protein
LSNPSGLPHVDPHVVASRSQGLLDLPTSDVQGSDQLRPLVRGRLPPGRDVAPGHEEGVTGGDGECVPQAKDECARVEDCVRLRTAEGAVVRLLGDHALRVRTGGDKPGDVRIRASLCGKLAAPVPVFPSLAEGLGGLLLSPSSN